MCFFGEHFLQCKCVSHCLRWGVLLVFPYEIYRLSCDIADIFGPIMYFFLFFLKVLYATFHRLQFWLQGSFILELYARLTLRFVNTNVNIQL